ncbi:MAG: hypothetical protein J6Z47_03145 [Bacteroidales bacterium]|nr:hypothetical protein [Bacteroidales bacterium]
MKKPNENPSKVVIVPKPPKETSDPSTQSEPEVTQENTPDEEKPEKTEGKPEV